MSDIPENGLLVFIDIEQPGDCNESPGLVMKCLPTIRPKDAVMLLEGTGFNMICEEIEKFLREAAGWTPNAPGRMECKILPFKKKT